MIEKFKGEKARRTKDEAFILMDFLLIHVPPVPGHLHESFMHLHEVRKLAVVK